MFHYFRYYNHHRCEYNDNIGNAHNDVTYFNDNHNKRCKFLRVACAVHNYLCVCVCGMVCWLKGWGVVGAMGLVLFGEFFGG